MKRQTYYWGSKATKGVKLRDRKKSEPGLWVNVPREIIERVRGRASQAWCKPSTSSTEMDCDLAEEFAHILEQDTRAWRHKVEEMVCVIEELIPLCKASRRWIELPSAESVIRAENMVDEYRKDHPKMPDSQSPSDVAKRA